MKMMREESMHEEGESKLGVPDQIIAFKRMLAPRRAGAEACLRRGEGSCEPRCRRDPQGHGVPAGRSSPKSTTATSGAARFRRACVRRSAEPVVRSCAASSRRRLRATGSPSSAPISRPTTTSEREVEKRSLDKYFSALKAGKPQIFNVYWSKPQVMARQDPKLAETRAFLDRLWTYEGVFDPDKQCTYADRVRRRQPGDKTFGLSPHMDAGTVERWIDPGYQKVYESVFAGDWRRYDPFDGTHRLKTREIPSPAVCSVFRTYQGWTALTRQGPRDGTLRLIPIADGISYVLLRALAGRRRGRRSLRREARPRPRHQPRVAQGADGRHGLDPGSPARRHGLVAYRHLPRRRRRARRHGIRERHLYRLGAGLRKNRAYLPKQKAAFLAGRSAPDFAAMDFEVDFKGRATEKDLTELGRQQMGF